jgi:hypothetical protein
MRIKFQNDRFRQLNNIRVIISQTEGLRYICHWWVGMLYAAVVASGGVACKHSPFKIGSGFRRSSACGVDTYR